MIFLPFRKLYNFLKDGHCFPNKFSRGNNDRPNPSPIVLKEGWGGKSNKLSPKAIFSNKVSPTVKFIIFCVVIMASWPLGHSLNIDREVVYLWLERFPLFISGLIFVILYVACTSLIWFTKDLLRIAAAFVFGIYVSTTLIWIAEVVNASILFHLSRALGKEFVENQFLGKANRWNERLEGLNFWDLWNLRAVVLIPFRFLDLGCGLTKISFQKYFTAVVLGSPIRIFFQQFFWVVLGERLWKNFDHGVDYMSHHPMIAGCVILYSVWTVVVFLRLKKKLF